VKKIVISLIILGVFSSFGYFFLRRTPEKILLKQFDFDLSRFEYEILYDNEKWNPNGDGYHTAGFKLNNLTYNDLLYFQNRGFIKLPIKTTLKANDIPSIWKKKQKGYYKLLYFDTDKRNFEILIFDLTNKEMVMYYQIE